jgi:muconolactone delta-isomerase
MSLRAKVKARVRAKVKAREKARVRAKEKARALAASEVARALDLDGDSYPAIFY